jgi:SAM-dependent methyltransferase
MRSIACEVCGSHRHLFLFEGWDRIFGLPGIFTIVQCEECGLLFVNPQPEREALKDYYPRAYYARKSSHYREYSWLRKLVLKAYFGYDNCLDSSKSWRLFRKVILLPFKVRYRSSLPFVEKGRLLDVGCGNGTELYKLKSMGWEAYGVEVDEDAAARARSKGLDVFTGDLFERNFPDHFFHVVRMSFVLEHLPNPRETLQEIKRILQPQGRIYISIQNARSLHYWLFGKRWFSLDVPRHLFSFTPKTMQKLLAPLGLEIKTIRFDSGTRTFLVSLQYWMNDRYQRGAVVQARQAIAESRLLKFLFRLPCWLVDRIRLGDLIYLEVLPR